MHPAVVFTLTSNDFICQWKNLRFVSLNLSLGLILFEKLSNVLSICPGSSNLFDQLGAKDIFKRFNCFLESWKCWQDDERQCKEMLGFDLEKKLVDSLCIFPSGKFGFLYHYLQHCQHCLIRV